MGMGAGEAAIAALLSRGAGHQFVCYGDSCSGVAGALHERTFAAVNGVVARIRPRPEFVCFPGDEIIGLVADAGELRRQWAHWFEREMAWYDRAIPLYHTTGNHTTFDAVSEAVFREVLGHLPRNGPAGQEGLSYWVRRGDLVLVFVNTLWSGLGGEGRVETDWLDRTLAAHADARYKLVFGHHPAWPVNGFSGAYQRELAPENAARFWRVLVRHGVLAYWCSHILAFDVQVREGVLQITTAGAGTAHRMPEGVEYLHCIQAALDREGLRYQVLDTDAQVRERLSWPIALPPAGEWAALAPGVQEAPVSGVGDEQLVAWEFSGVAAESGEGDAQTLLAAWGDGIGLATPWVGLLGQEQRLGVLINPAPGRSPSLWLGPALPPGRPFAVQLAIHGGMGPGGILWRWGDAAPWSSLRGASSRGAELLVWPSRWGVGHDRHGAEDRPFRGTGLGVTWIGMVLPELM